jgi:hypothetical protein
VARQCAFLPDRRLIDKHVEQLKKPSHGGYVIISTFAWTARRRCSGLPIVRYDAASLSTILGSDFELIDARRHDHATPWGAMQRFQFSTFRRN